MKKAIMLFSAAVVLASSMAALAQECPDLALAFSKDADSMAPKDLAALRRCVDTKLREKAGVPNYGTGLTVPSPGVGTAVPPPKLPPVYQPAPKK